MYGLGHSNQWRWRRRRRLRRLSYYWRSITTNIQITNGFYRLDDGRAGLQSCSCTIPLYPSLLYIPAFPSRISSQKSKDCRASRLNILFQVYRIADTSISFAKTAMPRAYHSAVSRSPQRSVGAKYFPSLSHRLRSFGLLGYWFEPSSARHTNIEPILTSLSTSCQLKFRKDNELRQIRKSTQPLTN